MFSVEGWPEGVADKLELPCSVCHQYTDFDYTVTDAFWNLVAPPEIRRDVICLKCFDKLAFDRGLDVSEHLLKVQYTGVRKTVLLIPRSVFHHI